MNLKQEADLILASRYNKKEKIKKLCVLVREIPYKRIGSLDPKDMLKAGKGSCTPKHLFLASYFIKMGIYLKFLILPFYYKKLTLKYPKDKMYIVENMPVAYHVALKIEIEGNWRVIDVTWDTKLKQLGFNVNDDWNLQSDMKLGVVPEKIIEKNDDPRKFELNKIKQYSMNEIQARTEFYSLFDKMIESCRKNS